MNKEISNFQKSFNKEKETPRPYLSWSQLSLLEKSEYEYVRVYIYGEGIKENPLLKIGKMFADAMQFQEDELPIDFEIAKLVIPEFQKREFMLKGMVDDVPIFFQFYTSSVEIFMNRISMNS